MPLHVGVALYLITGSRIHNIPSYFHWVMVASEALSWASQPVLTLELKRNSNGAYVHSFAQCNIHHSSAFRGIIHLFTTSNYTLDSFLRMVEYFPASDSGWRYPGRYGPQGWTCATWILQILSCLREEGTWVSYHHFEQTYTRVLNLGSELLEGTDAAEYQGPVCVMYF